MSPARLLTGALLGVIVASTSAFALDHKVVSGDTLAKLSDRYGVSISAIQAANGRTGITIYLGETLVIPTSSPNVSGSADVEKRIEYTVRPSDSLWLIGLRHGVTVRELRAINGLSAGSLIHPGDVLTVVVRRDDAPAQPTAPAVPLSTGAAAARMVERMAAAATEVEVLARIVKGETTPRTPYEGKVAVAAVVLNRVRSRSFPNSISRVAHQRKQFSCYNANERNRLYYGKIPDWAWRAAREALSGSDPTGGSTHYFNPYVVKPGWRHRLQFVRRIGHTRYKITTTHDFYRPKGMTAAGLAGSVD